MRFRLSEFLIALTVGASAGVIFWALFLVSYP